jgi:ribosomal protein S20
MCDKFEAFNTECNAKRTSAQEKIRGANGAFDSAVRALGRVKQKLEKAKGPFERAMEKLRHAQRKVDNLCRIRTCSANFKTTLDLSTTS